MKSLCNQFSDFNLLAFAATLLLHQVINLNLIYSLDLVAVTVMNSLTVRVMVMDSVTVMMTLVATVMAKMMAMTMVIDSVMNLVTAVMVTDLIKWKACF